MAREGYYNNGFGGRDAQERRGPLLFLLDSLLTLLSGVTAALMLLVWIVPRIAPAYMWALPMLGLVAPAIYVLTVILALYWIVRWRLKRAALMGALMLIGSFSISLFWRPEVRRQYAVNSYGRSAIKVLTYNVRQLYDDRGESNADGIAALIDSLRPDILCLQEWNTALAAKSEALTRAIGRYQSARFGLQRDASYPQLILSRHRILRSGVITTPRTSVWADLLISDDTVRVVSNHLQSTGITSLDNAYITGYEYLLDTAREEKIRSIVGRFHENCVLRADQVDSIRMHLDNSAPRYRIVCGDFNDTPVSYTYRRMAGELNDAFSACGTGYSHTFRGFFNALRIDYVLYSDEFEALSYEVPSYPHSDHLPVFVRLKKMNTL